ncbi:MAG TPA: hypothetical protein VH092_21655, partial [Urbifossiella sp.]|nr:hypothetical protein [Urbifossiella sp.]
EIQVDAEVTESRQVTITLPPEVPVGRVRLTVGVPTAPPATLPRFDVTDTDREPDGYRSGLVIMEGLPPGAVG